jgi:hypothetical protein
MMKFAQVIEFSTGRIDEFNASSTSGWPDPTVTGYQTGAVLRQDRDDRDRYLLMVGFASYEPGMENSGGPRSGSSPCSWPGSAMGAEVP